MAAADMAAGFRHTLFENVMLPHAGDKQRFMDAA